MTLGILSALTFIFYAIAPLFYWRRRGVPSAFSVPFFGSVAKAAFLQKFIGEVYADMYRKFEGKKYVGYLKFMQPAVLMRDPELIKNMLIRDFDHFLVSDFPIDENIDPILGKHVFCLKGERWKRLRMSLSPGYTSGKMKSLYPIVYEISDRLRTYLEECVNSSGDSVYPAEMKDISSRFATEVVASMAFGLHCDAIRNPDTEFRRMGKKVLEPSTSKALLALFLFEFPWLNKYLRIPFISDDVSNFFRALVFNVLTKREDEGIERSDYIQFFAKLWKEGKLRPDYSLHVKEKEDGVTPSVRTNQVSAHSLKDNLEELNDITAQALGIVIDGSETSSTLMSFIFLELAHNPEVQQKLRETIEDAKRRHGEKITYEALQEIAYLEMTILETLRLYPPAAFTNRLCTKRYLLPNPSEDSSEGSVWLEEGKTVIFPIYALHHDPNYYPNPEVFDPERFTSEAKRSRLPCTYLPFGEGPRICIGMRFALLQIKIILANVITAFELLPNEKTTMPITLDPNNILTSSKYGFWVNLRPLKEKTA